MGTSLEVAQQQTKWWPPHALLSLFPCSSLSQRPASQPHHLLLKQQPQQPQQQLAPRPQPPSRWTAPSMARLVSLKAMCWSSSQRIPLTHAIRNARTIQTPNAHNGPTPQQENSASF